MYNIYTYNDVYLLMLSIEYTSKTEYTITIPSEQRHLDNRIPAPYNDSMG